MKPTPTYYDILWNQRFQELKDYKKIHGDCNVPRSYKSNPSLGEWINHQRKARYDMSPERRIQLDSVGLTWKLSKGGAPNHALWHQRFQELKEFKNIHCDCNVPKVCKLNPALGRWVQRQRNQRETILEERKAKLNNIGFLWIIGTGQTYPKHALWDQHFQELQDYKQQHGDCNVPKVCKHNPTLGSWVHRQRENREMMLEERKATLNTIGFQWSIGTNQKFHGDTNDDNSGDKKTLHTLSRQEDNDSALIKELKSTLKSWVERLIEIKIKHFGGETTPSPAQLCVAELLRNSKASEYELVETMQVINSELMTLEGRVVKSTIGVVSK